MNLLSDAVDGYKALGNAAGAKFLREESPEAAGAAHPCWVVEVPSRLPATGMMLERSPTTYWVDKSTNLIWKELFSIKIKLPSNDQVQNQTVTTPYTLAPVHRPGPPEP